MSCLTCLSCLSVLSVGNVGVLWPNGRTDQDAAWYGGRPWPQAILCWLGTQPATESGPHSTPTFWPITIVAKRLDGSGYHLVGGSPRTRRHCDRWGPSSRHGKGHTSPPPLFDQRLLWLSGRPSRQLLSSCFILRRIITTYLHTITRHMLCPIVDPSLTSGRALRRLKGLS